MKRILLLIIPAMSFADGYFPLWDPNTTEQPTQQTIDPSQINQNEYYINPTVYIQDPYSNQTSGGGTLVLNESSMNDGFWSKLFTDGTYNVYGGATTSTGSQGRTQTGTFNGTSAYGINGFAQTGHVAGFALGVGATVMNPFFASQMNGANVNAGLLTPTNQQTALTQAYLEYQFSNIVNVDVGYIGINNSPWLTGSYFADSVSVPVTYQGALVNIHPGGGWLLTALAFNGIQTSGTQGFTGNTLYNKQYAGSVYSQNASSSGTMALGGDYKAWANNYEARIWAYQFENYGNMFYGDNSLTVPLSQNAKFNFAAQGGINNSLGFSDAYTMNIDILNQDYKSAGSINSNFIGGQAGFTYDWFNLTLSADTIWGPSYAVGNGAIISPYTVGFGADPLYTEGFLTNMVNQGITGNSYKASFNLTFLDNNLVISPNYLTLGNANSKWNGTQEAFLTANYTVPQIKGLHFYGGYAYQWLPAENPSDNSWTMQLLASYLW